MIVGTGIDIVELERIKAILERNPRFQDRILTEYERDTFNQLKGQRQIEFLAGRFAAKEALAKALGTGIGKHLSFQDIEIRNEPSGKPYFSKLKFIRNDSSNKPYFSKLNFISPAPSEKPFFAKTDIKQVHLSISHSKQFVIAQVIIEN